MVAHVVGHYDHRVGARRNQLTQSSQYLTIERRPPARAVHAQNVVSSKSHDQRYALRHSQQPALAKLRMDQIVLLPLELIPQPLPGLEVIDRVLGAAKGEDLYVNTGASKKRYLARDKRGPVPSVNPLAGDS